MKDFYKLDPELEDILKKIIRRFDQDVRLHKYLSYEGYSALGLANMSGNHLFDDFPEWFYLTKNEGHRVRAYFQENSNYRDKEFQDYIDSITKSLDTHHCPFCKGIAKQIREEFLHNTKDENGNEIKYLAPFWKCFDCNQNWMDQIQEDELDDYLESKVVDKSYFQRIRKIKEEKLKLEQ